MYLIGLLRGLTEVSKTVELLALALCHVGTAACEWACTHWDRPGCTGVRAAMQTPREDLQKCQ